ncbi:GNAT family N-acetyltransferase [Streptomyces sp. WAC 00631]|uniref:GNAT family N-acetyltransferase n=1 Tax=Streptomyces sp. WAC 00631 TaxID=2203201 RepID=UPI000F7B35D5|nr:GNAT family N-acetyltransferase [Streptomyces sp. WAC 00631]MCC5036138.1 GNAT family N-acetyltransferase [Streptomyces sp. WAC 00631]
MDTAAILALYDDQMRRGAPADSAGARVERVGDVVRQLGAEGAWNCVLWSDLGADSADAAIAAQIRHFASLGQEFEWKLYGHDRPADLGERLRAAGLIPEPEETLMVAPTQELSTAVELPDGLSLRPVTDSDGVELMVRVHEEVFGPGRSLRQHLTAQLPEQPETVVMTVVMAGELPVSSARLELYPGTDFAGLWGGGTLPAWRGRGVYRALVAHRARIAAERGYRYLQVDASDESRPILRRLGFTALSTTTPYVFRP